MPRQKGDEGGESVLLQFWVLGLRACRCCGLGQILPVCRLSVGMSASLCAGRANSTRVLPALLSLSLSLALSDYVRTYVCIMYVCAYVCMCVYIYNLYNYLYSLHTKTCCLMHTTLQHAELKSTSHVFACCLTAAIPRRVLNSLKTRDLNHENGNPKKIPKASQNPKLKSKSAQALRMTPQAWKARLGHFL